MNWKRSSLCDTGACVEVCDHSTCVEVGRTLTGAILIRDGKLGIDSPLLKFAPDEWRAFLDGAKAGEFDLS